MPASVQKRYLSDPIRADLRHKMVFLGGPRQVGKTTLALSLLPQPRGAKAAAAAALRHPGYLNWDNPAVRPPLLRREFPGGQRRAVLDEIHKYP